MPNFWGCRCCQNNRPIYLRFLNRYGEEQWVWRDSALAEVFRFNKPSGFSIGPDGRVAFAGGQFSYQYGLIDEFGKTIFSNTLPNSGSALKGAYQPSSDSDGNIYFMAGKDISGYPTNHLMSYDASGLLRFEVPLSTSGPDTSELHLSGSTVFLFEAIGTTKRLNVFDTDGNLIGFQDFTLSEDKSVLFGVFGINSSGNASFVVKKHTNNNHARLCEVDSTASIVDIHNINPGIGLISPTGYGTLSDGKFVLATRQQFIPATIPENIPYIYSLTDDEVLYTLRPSGTVFQAYNCQFDGDGFIYYVHFDISTGNSDTIYCLDESGNKIWSFKETANGPIVACSPQGVLIGTHQSRPRKGGVLTIF